MQIQDLITQIIKTTNDLAHHVGADEVLQDMVDTLKDASTELHELDLDDKSNLVASILTTVHGWFQSRK